MTLLDPISGAVAAAVAVPTLLALYFLKLRRRPVRVSSTLLWRRAVHDLQVNAPFRWIRPSWLLLLQLLALACLLTAFARPAIDAGRGAATRTVILIDRSASMSALDADERGDRSRLERAKAEALDLIDRLGRAAGGEGGRRAEAVVIAFAHQPRALTAFTANRNELRRAVESITPTDQPADLDAAVKLVQATIARPEEEADAGAPPARVVLCSDGAFDLDRRPVRSGLGDAEITLVRIGPPPGGALVNTGIVAASARRDYEDAGLVRVFARLQSTLPQPADATLALSVNAAPYEARTVTIPAATPDAPGEAPVAFEVRGAGANADAPAVLTLALSKPDSLISDDTAHLVIDPPRAARILIVGPGDISGPDVNPFLERAVRVVNPREPETIGAGRYEVFAMEPVALAPYDLVIFDRVRPVSLPPSPSLSFGAGLPIPGMSMTEPAERRRSNVLWWRGSHPALRYVGLAPIGIARRRVLTLPRSDSDRPDPFVVDTIASGVEGPLIAQVEQRAVKRLIVSFDLSHSTWPISVGFPVFIANAIEYRTSLGAGAPARAWTTAEPVTLQAAPGAEIIRLEGPAEVVATVRPGQEEAVSAGVLARAGLYRADGGAPRDAVVAVNLVDPFESAIPVRDEVSIAGRDVRAGSLGEASPREVWMWFVLAALLLLVLEWLLYAWRTRV